MNSLVDDDDDILVSDEIKENLKALFEKEKNLRFNEEQKNDEKNNEIVFDFEEEKIIGTITKFSISTKYSFYHFLVSFEDMKKILALKLKQKNGKHQYLTIDSMFKMPIERHVSLSKIKINITKNESFQDWKIILIVTETKQ